MSSNLIGGFFNRLEASRKYLFGSMGVLGETGNSVISGALIARGQDIIPVVDVAPDYESYSYKKLDLENAEDKAFFEAANAWDLEIDGKKWVDGKNVRICIVVLIRMLTPSLSYSSSKHTPSTDVVLAVSIALLCLPRSIWSLLVLCIKSKLCQKAKRTGRCICAGASIFATCANATAEARAQDASMTPTLLILCENHCAMALSAATSRNEPSKSEPKT